MAATTVLPARSYPKRKRVEVSYCEESSGDSDVEYDGDSLEKSDSRKKPKTTSKAAWSKPLPKRKIFPFNSLPAEIRNTIYAHALTDRNGIFLISKLKAYRRIVKREPPSTAEYRSFDGWRRHGRHYMHAAQTSDLASNADSSSDTATLPALIPNLLALNRQIRAETQPILYAANAFVLEDTTALHNFLATIGARNAAVLADLTVKGWGYSKAHKALNYPAFTLLAGAVNLTRLHLNCLITWDTRPRRVAMQVYRDGFHWMEAVGAAKGRFDAALEIIEVVEENFDGRRGYGSDGPKPRPSHEESMAVFKSELRQLLRAR